MYIPGFSGIGRNFSCSCIYFPTGVRLNFCYHSVACIEINNKFIHLRFYDVRVRIS